MVKFANVKNGEAVRAGSYRWKVNVVVLDAGAIIKTPFYHCLRRGRQCAC